MQLDEIRRKIDDVDERICQLLKERFDLAKEVGELKKVLSLNVENKNRENEVLKAVRMRLPDEYKDYAQKVFELLIEESKDLQNKL